MTTWFKFITLLSLAAAAASVAAGLFDKEAAPIWRAGANLYVKYAAPDSPDQGDNDHPVTLNADEITPVLDALQFWDKKLLSTDEEPQALFSRGQSRLLGEQLAKGLETAEPQQDIIFVLEKVNRGFLGLADKTFVSGRAFYQQGRLNLILGEYDRSRNQAFESAYDPSGQGRVPYSFYHGSRANSSSFNEKLIEIAGVENKQTDELRRDWLVLDLPTASQALSANKQEQESGQNADTAAIQDEAAQLARERRAMRLDMARMRKEMRNQDSAESIEERLAQLDALLDKALISQEEYAAKRQEILNDL